MFKKNDNENWEFDEFHPESDALLDSDHLSALKQNDTPELRDEFRAYYRSMVDDSTATINMADYYTDFLWCEFLVAHSHSNMAVKHCYYVLVTDMDGYVTNEVYLGTRQSVVDFYSHAHGVAKFEIVN